MGSEEWDRRYAGTELIWSAEPNRFAEAELRDLPPGRALDLGAGEGRNAVWLAGRGWHVTAVDFSAVGLDKGRRLAASRGVSVDWVHADVQSYQPEAGAFQLVLIAYLQMPAAELTEVLHGAVRALAPGGTLLVVGHDVDNLTRGAGGPQDPAVLYTTELITESLDGLTVLRADQVRRPLLTSDSNKQAIDTLVRAVRDTHS